MSQLIHSDECPRCGTKIGDGYGFAYGGFGAYQFCLNERCGWFVKDYECPVCEMVDGHDPDCSEKVSTATEPKLSKVRQKARELLLLENDQGSWSDGTWELGRQELEEAIDACGTEPAAQPEATEAKPERDLTCCANCGDRLTELEMNNESCRPCCGPCAAYEHNAARKLAERRATTAEAALESERENYAANRASWLKARQQVEAALEEAKAHSRRLVTEVGELESQLEEARNNEQASLEEAQVRNRDAVRYEKERDGARCDALDLKAALEESEHKREVEVASRKELQRLLEKANRKLAAAEKLTDSLHDTLDLMATGHDDKLTALSDKLKAAEAELEKTAAWLGMLRTKAVQHINGDIVAEELLRAVDQSDWSVFNAQQPATPQPAETKCAECGGDGYYKGPRLGDEACPACKGSGVQPPEPLQAPPVQQGEHVHDDLLMGDRVTCGPCNAAQAKPPAQPEVDHLADAKRPPRFGVVEGAAEEGWWVIDTTDSDVPGEGPYDTRREAQEAADRKNSAETINYLYEARRAFEDGSDGTRVALHFLIRHAEHLEQQRTKGGGNG